jgi:uncharacterized protein (TIGR03086 family)
MTSPPQWATATFDGPGLLERSVGYTRTSLQLVVDADLHAPTPCTRWDLLALLRHMDDSLAAFTEAAAIGYVDLVPVPEGDTVSAAARTIVDRLRVRACALLAAWSREPRGTDVAVADRVLDSDLLAAAGALEIAVHGWDVACACGADRPLPTGLALDLLPAVPVVVSDLDRPRRFAERLAVPPHATPQTRLLAALGRRADQPRRRGSGR